MHRINPQDAGWPLGFSDLPDPPEQLYLLGKLPDVNAPVVAVVGTRRSTRRAEAFTEDLAADFARSGHWVVSGGADGIDAAAHRGALREGGRSIVVQAGGLHELYPKKNQKLFESLVAAGGALVSENHPSTPPHRGLFLKRNRLVASWAQSTWVTQAPKRSGAMHTAHIALRLGRSVHVALGAPWDERHHGCAMLFGEGAQLIEASRSANNARFENVALSTDAQQILQFVEADEGQSADQLAERAGLSGAKAARALFTLEMARVICNRGGLYTSSGQ